MANLQQSSVYHCITQKGTGKTYGFPPASKVPSGFDAINVGLGDLIPRWNTSPSQHTTLKWFLKADGFPSADVAMAAAEAINHAAEAMNQAAREWNNMAFGVIVSQTMDEAAANFNLIYKVNGPTEDMEGVYAEAFFPNQAHRDVIVYEFGMEESNRYKLKNVFLHELGHVFGLRHEFALEEEGDGAKQFMKPNKDSVMDYNDLPTIQETDKEGIRQFYKLADRTKIDGSPVTDYLPQLRSTNQSSH